MTTLAVRNQNPGNLRNSSGGFQSFSDPIDGKAALYNDLTMKMTGKSKTGLNGDSSLLEFAKTYAPASDKNDPVQYAADLANKLKVSPDTKIGTLSSRIDDFARAVASNEDSSVKYESTNTGSDMNAPSSQTPPQTFDEYLKQNPGGASPASDLKAGNPKTPGDTTIGNAIADFTPGTKLAQGAGYAIAQGLGSQEGLIKANNQGIDIEGQLLKQIKDNKAKGKDTTRLEKALKGLMPNLQSQANSASDVGTGGISNGDVIKSAGALATLPALAYGSGLLKGVLQGGKMLADPEISEILTNAAGKGTASTMSRQGAINALGNALKEQTVAENGGPLEQKILTALKELNPTLKEKTSLLAKVGKGVLSTAKGLALTKILGDTVGGFIHRNTP